MNINNRMGNNFLVGTGRYNQQPPSLSATPKPISMSCEQKKAFLYNKAKIKQINQQVSAQMAGNGVDRAIGFFLARGNLFSVILSALMELLKNQKDVLKHGAEISQTVNQNMTKISNSVYYLQQALDNMLYAITTGPDKHNRFGYSIPKIEDESGYIHVFWKPTDRSSTPPATCRELTGKIREAYETSGYNPPIMKISPFFVILQLLKRGFPQGVSRLDHISLSGMYMYNGSLWALHSPGWDSNSFDCYVLNAASRYIRLKTHFAWLQGQESGISADKDQINSNLDAALNDDSLILREIKKLLDKQNAAGKKLGGFGG